MQTVEELSDAPSSSDTDAHLQKVAGVLQKRFLASADHKEKVRIINDIAHVYEADNKRSLVSLCIAESLWLNPSQHNLIPLLKDSLRCVQPVQHSDSKEECLVSVIIPTYNRPDELKESIRSVLNQTIQDLEIIVINDGGGDAAEEVVDHFHSPKIRYQALSSNSGLPAARNAGLRLARGRYVAYLDDDDVFYDNHLELLSDFLDAHAEFGVAYANAWWAYGDIIDRFFIAREKKTHPRRPAVFFDKGELFERNYISTLSIMHRRELLKESGMFNEELPKLEDWEFLLRLSLNNRFAQINEITGEYRWKHNNISLGGHLEMEFWTQIIRSFYATFSGKVTLAWSSRLAGDIDAVKRYLGEIEEDYPCYPKEGEVLMQLVDLASGHGNRSFRNLLYRDYFDASPRRYIKDLVEKKSAPMAFAALPIFPRRALRGMANRCMRRLPFSYG